MYKVTIRRPSCMYCEFYKYYSDSFSKRTHGVMLHAGDNYCIAGKKYRIIKGKGATVSAGCPKLKTPPELRVYTFKDNTSYCFNRLLAQRMGPKPEYPLSLDYALRFEGRSPVSAQEFAQLLDKGQAIPDLGTPVATLDVVEIDDGLKPYFFYNADGGYRAVLFGRDVARENRLKREVPDIEAQPGSEGE